MNKELLKINKLTITKDIRDLIINVDILNSIKEEIKLNCFSNNTIDYITFIFYENYIDINIISTQNKKEPISTYKKFKEISTYNDLLFKKVFTIKDIKLLKNDINNMILSKSNIKFIHFTINFNVFDFILNNLNNNIIFKLDNNNEIKMNYSDISINGVMTVY